MRNLLYIDLFPEKAHTNFNKILIDNLSDNFNVEIFTQVNYFDKKTLKKNSIKEYKLISIKYFSKITIRIRSIYIILKSLKLIEKNNNNLILIPTFETVTFYLYKLIYKNLKNFYIIHHLNIDELKNPIKKWIFKKYMNTVNHIVFEDFFKQYLVNEIGINNELVYVMHHPLMQINNFSKIESDRKKICIGLSNSNNENLIEEIIETEKNERILEKSNTFLILKSKNLKFTSNHLNVFNNFISIELYNSYIDQSSIFLMLYSENFKYRESGFMYDGLSNKKIVIGNDVPILNLYSKLFPLICKIGLSAKEILELISSTTISIEADKQFDEFLNKYSNKIFFQQLNKILN